MNQNVAVINESSQLEDVEISTYISAVQEQMDKTVGPAWNFQIKLNQIPKGDPAPTDQWWMVFLDNSDMAGALGYHDLTNANLPIGKVFVKTTMSYNQTVSRVFSHETAEMMVDPGMNRLIPYQNKQYLVEVGDILSLDEQGELINDVLVSGIALPDYYYNTGTNYDTMGLIHGNLPTAINGTYLMWLENGSWQNKMYCLSPDDSKNINMEISNRPVPGSRRYRRMIGISNWIKSTVKHVR